LSTDYGYDTINRVTSKKVHAIDSQQGDIGNPTDYLGYTMHWFGRQCSIKELLLPKIKPNRLLFFYHNLYSCVYDSNEQVLKSNIASVISVL